MESVVLQVLEPSFNEEDRVEKEIDEVLSHWGNTHNLIQLTSCHTGGSIIYTFIFEEK
jgi:hypothetical protein